MDQLDQRLADAVKRYVKRRPRSAALHERAQQFLPGGNTRSVLDISPYPFKVEFAEGAYLTDVDGHRYLDLLGDYTAGLLGHNPAPIRAAISAALDRGWGFGATHAAEVEFAELLCERFPSLERVRFTNSGTEANLMALATAKHVTERSTILMFTGGYHGGVLYYGATGRPIAVPHDVVHAPYDQLDGLDELFATHDLAAVLVEPMLGAGGCIPASPAFLQRLRDLCDEHATVLIFDEVMTSRLSVGGRQLLLGITPDMTTLGKYLAGGMSFGAFGGRADLMDVYRPESDRPVSHGGTFNNNVLTINAGIAALRSVLTADALQALNERGDKLRQALVEPLAALDISVSGLGSLIGIHAIDPRRLQLLFFDLLEAGYYFAPRGFIALSLAVTDDDLTALVETVERYAELG